MKIRITFEITADERKALGYQHGTGPASYATVRRWIEAQVEAMLGEVLSDFYAYQWNPEREEVGSWLRS